jgi:hypothetical protein
MAPQQATKRFLGTGWKFPMRITPAGGLTWSSGDESVQEAIWILLTTSRGERT